MRILGRSKPDRIESGSPIRADWLNQVAKWLVRNVSVNGAKFQQVGGSLVMDIGERGRGGGRLSQVAMGTIDAVTGASHSAVYDVSSYDGSIVLTSQTPYLRPIDSGGTLTAASVGDLAMLAMDAAGDWFLWMVPEVIKTAQCSSNAGPQTFTNDANVAAQTTTVLIDTTSNSVQATLPNAADNDSRVIRTVWIAGANAATVASAGGNIRGVAGPITIRSLYDGLSFQANDGDWWEV